MMGYQEGRELREMIRDELRWAQRDARGAAVLFDCPDRPSRIEAENDARLDEIDALGVEHV